MQHSTLPTVDRQALTLSLLEQFTPYLHTAARFGRLDFDDLYQDAAIKIMQILDHYRDQVHHLQAYVSMSMRNLVLNKIRYTNRRNAVSLDDPLLDVADYLPDPYRDPIVVILAQERLGELQLNVSIVKHPGTRRMLCEMHATALAAVSIEERC